MQLKNVKSIQLSLVDDVGGGRPGIRCTICTTETYDTYEAVVYKRLGEKSSDLMRVALQQLAESIK